MKKSIALVLCVCMAMCGCLTACKQENGTSVSASSEGQQESSAFSEEESSIDSAKFAKEWGTKDSFNPYKNGKIAVAYINFPSLAGNREYIGKVANQNDGTTVLVGTEREDYPLNVEKGTCDAVFPTYFEHVIKIVDSFRSYEYSDFTFSIANKENVTINEYEMCRYEGTHTYMFNDKKITTPFVAYATKIKSNGAFFYWMVWDDSKDLSLGTLVSENAEKMAYTLMEEETTY